jgi:hypothetical protein
VGAKHLLPGSLVPTRQSPKECLLGACPAAH